MDAQLSEIRPLRRKLGLTQQQLARAANVSQSLVAKVESGLVDPSYSAARQLFAALRSFERKQEPSAKELMQMRLVTCRADEKLTLAIAKMQKGALSQLPVLEQGQVVGMLTERAIIKGMARIRHGATIVREIMEDAPPIVPPETPRKVLAEILGHFSLVLVKGKGKVKGIVTKADLLRTI